MTRFRPAYLAAKIALERARREAWRTHVQPCDCPYCISRERVAELVQAAIARNAATEQEVPF